MYRSLLAMIFTYGASTTWPNNNPASRSLAFKQGKKRDRYITDDELDAIKSGALSSKDGITNPSGKMIVAFIDLAYATAQRVEDVLSLRWSDVSDEGVFFFPGKTRNSTAVRLLVERTAELNSIL